MENKPYQVSARKYRPTTFEEVVGQSFITDTLDKAIRENKIVGSILFSGPKGVGKTTCARILARKINEGFLEEFEDLSFNVFELDGASHNSVEDIRSLIEQIAFPPQKGKYKVYIIDEVHMLSQSAFNAFLKTLEEPPSYVVFILATTEKHKVLPTILSRCQLYEFRAISTEDIAAYLQKIASKENLKTTEEVLFLIASGGEGSIRDSLFLFDRLSIFSNGELTKEMVEHQLGILPLENYSKVIEFISEKDIFSILLNLGEILAKGFNLDTFLSGLAMYFRNLLLSKNEKTHALLEFSPTIKEKFLAESQKLSLNFLLTALEICKKGELDLKTSKNKRLSMEITLMQLASLGNETAKGPQKKEEVLPLILEEKTQNKIVLEKKEEVIHWADKKKTTEIKEIHQEKIVLINANSNNTTFSIKNALKEIHEISKAKKSEEKKINLPFSKEDFTKAWQDSIKEISLNRENPIFAILKNISFDIGENYKVDLYFSSRLAITEFENLEQEIVISLKQKLFNSSIEFNYKLTETNLQKKSLSTSIEKYVFFEKKKFFFKKINNHF